MDEALTLIWTVYSHCHPNNVGRAVVLVQARIYPFKRSEGQPIVKNVTIRYIYRLYRHMDEESPFHKECEFLTELINEFPHKLRITLSLISIHTWMRAPVVVGSTLNGSVTFRKREGRRINKANIIGERRGSSRLEPISPYL